MELLHSTILNVSKICIMNTVLNRKENVFFPSNVCGGGLSKCEMGGGGGAEKLENV